MHDLRIGDANGDALSVHLDAPARRNALTLDTVRALHDLLEGETTATLLLGSSTRGIFSAGADLDTDDDSRVALSDLLYACYEHIVSRPGIVIAVVDGAAVGGGAQLTAAADLRTISAQARWRWVGPGHGLAVGAWILPELVGRARGLDLVLTSRWMDAEEAVLAGMAPRVDSDPWASAEQIAARLTDADAAALARIKQRGDLDRLLERLRYEREENRRAWQGSVPSAHDAAAEGRDQR